MSTSDTALSESMGRDNGLLKWAGWCGLIASAAFIVTALVQNLLGSPAAPDNLGEVAKYLVDAADQSANFFVYGIAGITLCIFYLPLALAVQRVLQNTGTAIVSSIALIAGLGILIPAYVGAMLPATGLVQAGEDLGRTGDGTIYAMLLVIAAAVTIFFTVGSILTLCFVPFLWGLEGLRSGKLTRWVSWLGIATGIAGLSWFVWYFENPIGLIFLVLNLIGSLVFFITISIKLLRIPSPTDALAT